MTRNATVSMLVAGILLAGAAVAADLPNLPKAIALPQGADSPGKVTFNHDMHVDSKKPACLTCHPQAFGILGRSAQDKPAAITHDGMKAGQACGACHDGKKAFGFDDCTMCHAQ